jgi:hypothetical protein
VTVRPGDDLTGNGVPDLVLEAFLAAGDPGEVRREIESILERSPWFPASAGD